ncbi:MAG TPA: efflux RND transporter periplasmic adaptor subunit [Polyangiales bacterium]|nr:efflux RND transporter periplasmic adaptor subunit [Polyangiales bacterium]
MSRPALLIMGALALAACNAEARASERVVGTASIPVRLAAVERGTLDVPLRGSGTLGARHELDLSFKVGGVISQVLVEAGARVRKGQLLAVVDATELQAQLTSARQTLDKAERDEARVKGLHERGSMPLVEAQNAATGLELARAAVESARFNELHSKLIAPENGVIDRRLISAGEVVAPGRPVFHLSTTGGGPVARVNLTDRDILAVKLGDQAEVTLDARPEQALRAHVTQLASTATPGVGTFPVELTVDDPAARSLPSGLTIKARIAHQETQAVRVPVSALVEGRGRSASVYVVEGEKAKRVPVRLQRLAGDHALLAADEGLTTVVVSGASMLHDGALVRVVERGPSALEQNRVP